MLQKKIEEAKQKDSQPKIVKSGYSRGVLQSYKIGGGGGGGGEGGEDGGGGKPVVVYRSVQSLFFVCLLIYLFSHFLSKGVWGVLQKEERDVLWRDVQLTTKELQCFDDQNLGNFFFSKQHISLPPHPLFSFFPIEWLVELDGLELTNQGMLGVGGGKKGKGSPKEGGGEGGSGYVHLTCPPSSRALPFEALFVLQEELKRLVREGYFSSSSSLSSLFYI